MSTTAAQDSLLTGFDEFTAARTSDPAWLRTSRARAAATFRDEGLPTTRQEEWRYTPLTGITDVPAQPVAAATGTPPVDGFLFRDFDGPQLVRRNDPIERSVVGYAEAVEPDVGGAVL